MALPLGELFILGFRTRSVPPWLKNFAARFGLGGVILFDYDCTNKSYERNVFSPEQVRELCTEVHSLPSRPLVFVDQEGGKVRRLKERYGFKSLLSAKQLGASPPDQLEAQMTPAFAEMREIGIDVNLAPVIDVDYNPANPDLGAVERCYSSDIEKVRTCAQAMIRVADHTGVQLCLKHYPGCGGAKVNSHLDLMDLSEVIYPEQLALFDKLLKQVPMVLMSHGTVQSWERDVPLSLSRVAVERVRRENPNAVIVTDDLQMEGLQKRLGTGEAVRRAIAAGIDLLCIGNNLKDEQEQSAPFAESLLATVAADSNFGEQAAQAIERVQKLKARS